MPDTNLEYCDMKKFFALIVCLVISTMAYCQVACQFRYLEDGRMYLVIQNQSQFNFNAIGEVYRNNRLYNSETLCFRAGSTFILGPSTPWKWQWHRGDTYVITYPNGQRASWTCTQTDAGNSNGLSFKGRAKGSCNVPSHKCPGFINDGNKYCVNCAYQNFKCHAVNHQ